MRQEEKNSINKVCSAFSKRVSSLKLDDSIFRNLSGEIQQLQEELGGAEYKDALSRHEILAVRSIQNSIFAVIENYIDKLREKSARDDGEAGGVDKDKVVIANVVNNAKAKFRKILEDELIHKDIISSDRDQHKINHYRNLLPKAVITQSPETKALISILNKTYLLDLDDKALFPEPIKKGEKFAGALEDFIHQRVELRKAADYIAYESTVIHEDNQLGSVAGDSRDRVGDVAANAIKKPDEGLLVDESKGADSDSERSGDGGGEKQAGRAFRNNIVLPIQLDKSQLAAAVETNNGLFVTLAELVQFSSKKPDYSIISSKSGKGDLGRVIVGKASKMRTFCANFLRVMSVVACLGVSTMVAFGVSQIAFAALPVWASLGMGAVLAGGIYFAGQKMKKHFATSDVQGLLSDRGAVAAPAVLGILNSVVQFCTMYLLSAADSVQFGVVKSAARKAAKKVVAEKFDGMKAALKAVIDDPNSRDKEKKGAKKELKAIAAKSDYLMDMMVEQAVARAKEFDALTDKEAGYRVHKQVAFKISNSGGKEEIEGRKVKKRYKKVVDDIYRR